MRLQSYFHPMSSAALRDGSKWIETIEVSQKNRSWTNEIAHLAPKSLAREGEDGAPIAAIIRTWSTNGPRAPEMRGRTIWLGKVL